MLTLQHLEAAQIQYEPKLQLHPRCAALVQEFGPMQFLDQPVMKLRQQLRGWPARIQVLLPALIWLSTEVIWH
jgi:hypothetical protein